MEGGSINISSCVTDSKVLALEEIIKNNPEVLVLDMHLTDDEQFDGLWIANQLFEKGFEGDILIASSYGDEALQAMSRLIKGDVQIPGKSIDRIKECLFNL